MVARKYKSPVAGQPLLSTISSACKTPILPVKYCNLVNPFYYPNSSVPRYSITCLIDPELYGDFIRGIQIIEKNENVSSIIKNDLEKIDGKRVTTGKVVIKFQTREKFPIYIQKSADEAEEIELEDEFAQGEKVLIVYDILRYTKKNTIDTEHGISFKPTCAYYFPSQSEEGE